MNSGICVRGSDSNDLASNFYGYLKDVLQIEYSGSTMRMTVVLFEGDWFDPRVGMKVHSFYKLVDVNCKKLYRKYDPFILAQQAIQVYYCDYPSMKKDMVDWMAVCETKSRRVIDSNSMENEAEDVTAYQVEEIQQAFSVSTSEQTPSLFDQLQGIELEVDLGVLPQTIPSELLSDEEEFQSTESSDEDEDAY
ncbi:hypothetical protein COLO4_37631 [Corchorus olitorius]|uniref:DUF4216 domain-containing protein n=1 Tax=Corchorus olitorius TaxID=93759 RepID=A0A1R3G0D8_9ROSI|nr:hypothetical protein COLO4_37631 [Corchorus olitorius]